MFVSCWEPVFTVGKYEIVGLHDMLAIPHLGLWLQDLWVMDLGSSYSVYIEKKYKIGGPQAILAIHSLVLIIGRRL